MAFTRAFALSVALLGTALATPAVAQQPPTCDKTCLAGFMDKYLAALTRA